MTASSRPRRLLYVTQWFPPEPVAIPLWIARALRDRGWDIEVVTGQPNYPDGELHEGYSGRRYRREVEQGFRVLRTPLYASHDASAVKRMANYLSWAAAASLVAPWKSRGAGVTLVYSSPATAAVPAMLARLIVGRRYVLVIQDIWPDSVTAAGFIRESPLLRLVERMLHRFVNASYRLADSVVVISPGAAELLGRRGVPADKLHVIHNWADESVMRPAERTGALRERLGLSDEAFVVMYAGTMGPAQSLDHAVHAMDATNSDAHLVLVGSGVARPGLEELARKTSPARVHFLDPVPLSEIASLMADADAHLISLAPDPLFGVTMPSKVQSLLASGTVCIASAPGDAAAIVSAAGGKAVTPGNSAELASTIDELASLGGTALEMIRAAALAYYLENLSEASGANQLSSLLNKSLEAEKK